MALKPVLVLFPRVQLARLLGIQLIWFFAGSKQTHSFQRAREGTIKMYLTLCDELQKTRVSSHSGVVRHLQLSVQ